MTDQRGTPDTPRMVELNPGVDLDLIGDPETVTGHALRRPDTRTPSAEGCGHDEHAPMKYPAAPWNGRIGLFNGEHDRFWEPCPGQRSDAPSAPQDRQRECGHGKRAVLDRRYGWLHVRTGVGCEKPPSVPNRAPTDEALVERLRAAIRALEDLTRENERHERLRAESDSVDVKWAYALMAERDDLRRQVAAVREALASIEYNARSALAALDRGSFNREDASLRADYEWFATTAGAVLDVTSADRDSETR